MLTQLGGGLTIFVDLSQPILAPIHCGSRQAQADVVFDGVTYPIVPMEDILSGFASAPVSVDDNGHIYYTRMIAGSLGIVATSGVIIMHERNHNTPENDGDTISTVEQHQGVVAAQEPCFIYLSVIEYLSKCYRIG